jgi:DNA invertase Pin-like site-specific DNA recombinase
MVSDFVVYLRVSTDKQGEKGLGIEAQRAAVSAYLKTKGGIAVKEVVEVESGRDPERKQLLEAIKQCKRRKAVLLIAKLDRLARNVRFLENLKATGVRFVAADLPEADETHTQMLSVFAEHEARAVSTRTKAALAASKKQLGRINTPIEDLREMGLKGGAIRGRNMKKSADEFAELFLSEISKHEGKSAREIARLLNADGLKTTRGKEWSAVQVQRVLRRGAATA